MNAANQINSKETNIIIRELNRILERKIDGGVVEFGCYLGDTSIHLARAISNFPEKRLYVYDSFEGLPEKTVQDKSTLGESFIAGELYASKKQFIKNLQKANVPMPIIKKAWFSDIENDEVPPEIAFAFLDGDYYSSIKDSFKLIENKLAPGSTIIIDDYGNDALPGAKRAVDEWLQSHINLRLKVEQSLGIIYY